MMRVAALCLVSFMVFAFSAYGQNEKKAVRQGNKEFGKGEYLDSEISYRSALVDNPSSFKANFNLGDALYKQDKWEDAAKTFDGLANSQISDLEKAGVYHNLGNSYFKEQKFKESIEAYKQALRLNPNDFETKYNLSQAQRLLQQQDNQDNKDNKDNQDNQDNQDGENNQQEDKQNDEQKQNDQQDKPKDDQKQQEQNPQQISPEDAQRMLDAIQGREKDIQDKLKEEKAKQAKVKVEKNW